MVISCGYAATGEERREYIRENGEGILDDCRGGKNTKEKKKMIKEKKKVLGSIKGKCVRKRSGRCDVRTRKGVKKNMVYNYGDAEKKAGKKDRRNVIMKKVWSREAVPLHN